MHRLLIITLSILLTVCGTLLTLSVTGSDAQACSVATWTFKDRYDPADVLLNYKNRSFSYTHDITRDGFDLGIDHNIRHHDFDPEEDTVFRYRLAIGIRDDSHSDRLEWAYINLPGYISDEKVEVDFKTTKAGWSGMGLFQLNDDGKLTVNIRRLGGDFYFTESRLMAYSRKDSTSTPIPAPVLLLGIGLVGLVALRRRTKA